MHLEVFAEGDSPVHALEPRIKLLAFLPFALVTAVARGGACAAAALAVGLLLVAFSRLDTRELAMRMLLVNVFVLILWLVLPFAKGGETAFGLGPFRATYEGMVYAGVITLKINALVLVTIAPVRPRGEKRGLAPRRKVDDQFQGRILGWRRITRSIGNSRHLFRNHGDPVDVNGQGNPDRIGHRRGDRPQNHQERRHERRARSLHDHTRFLF